MRVVPTVLVAVLAALPLAACSSQPPARPAAARHALAAVAAPAASWTQGGRAVDDSFEVLSLHHGRGLWVAHPNRRTPTYLTTWQVRVRPGQETQRCTEAADWLARTGRALPGSSASASGRAAGRETAVRRCLKVLAQGGPDEAFDDFFASRPNTDAGGYTFGPYLIGYGSGSRLRLLSASVQARPQRD